MVTSSIRRSYTTYGRLPGLKQEVVIAREKAYDEHCFKSSIFIIRE